MKKKKTDAITRLLNAGSGLASACAGLLAIVLILYSGYVLYDSLATEVSAFSSHSDLLKYKPSAMAEGPDKVSLASINPDYRAWITVDRTPIDYPVVQGKDDLYYATHDANNENSLTGAIYLAAGNKADFTDSYNLLYGHHMDSGAMFGSLDKYKDETYFNAHRKATLTAENGKKYDVTFFAVASTDAYEKQIYNVGNRAKEVKAFLTGSRADDTGLGTKVLIYDTATAATANRILALSTCAGADTNGRLVVFGSMTEQEELTPTDEPTVTPTQTPTPTPTLTPTPTPTKGGGYGSATATPTPTSTPTETPGDGKVRLTVTYLDADGNRVFPDKVFVYMVGGRYYVVSPQKPGYDISIEVLRGTIEEDLTFIVRYTPKTYQLTVKFVFPDGTEASPTYGTAIQTGDPYVVRCPVIPGYRTMIQKITGVNPGRDEAYTVIYVPDGGDDDSGISRYQTPLNPGCNDLQIGVCAE